MDELRQCSLVVCKILDRMGYCRFIRDARKNKFNKLCDALNGLADAKGQWMLAGSKAEGISHVFQSDIDVLLICDCCEAREAFEDITTLDETKYYFQPKRGRTAPGYCLLKLIKKPSLHQYEFIERCLETLESGVECLHSEQFLKYYIRERRCKEEHRLTPLPYAGPSRPFFATPDLFTSEVDTVDTIPFPRCGDLDTWNKRSRHHDWPSESLRRDIVSTPANLTPIGSKKGYFGKMEWRFCFNGIEIKLMNSLNETQLKLFATLKMVLKDYLKPENKELTSYVMKNIVFWMCESNPVKSFTPDSLLHWIHTCLATLKYHIQEGNLPYYFIPERNLLHGKFVGEESKSELLGKLDKLLASGPNVVRVCTMIQFGQDLCTKKLLRAWGLGRDIMEIWFLNADLEISELAKGKIQINDANEVDDPVLEVMVPDLDILIAKGRSVSELVELMKKRVCVFLNIQKAEELAKKFDFSRQPFALLVEKLKRKYELERSTQNCEVRLPQYRK